MIWPRLQALLLFLCWIPLAHGTVAPHTASPAPSPLAFPTAVGFGAEATGGRGGQVIHVTNLNGSGAGSFAAAAQTSGPRVIVFNVAGNIPINERLEIPDGELTIACQSAPGGGISFVGGTLAFGRLDDSTPFANQQHIKTRNILIRHCRSRDAAASSRRGDNADGIQFLNADLVMLDHVSIAWAADESGAMRRSRRVTWQNCLITEPLINGKHSKGAHAYGPMASYGTHDWSMIGCFLSNGYRRFPHMMGNNYASSGRSRSQTRPGRSGSRERTRERSGRDRGRSRDAAGGRPQRPQRQSRQEIDRANLGPPHPIFLFAGNTIYNIGGPRGIGGSQVGLGAQAVIENNAYWRGPDTVASWAPVRGSERSDSGASGSQVWLAGNTLDGVLPADQGDLVATRHDMPPPGTSATRWTAPEINLAVLAAPDAVGALPHDAIDARVLNEFLSKTGQQGAPWRSAGDPVPAPAAGKPLPDSDRDGMPDSWERERKRNPERYDPWQDRDCNGWSDLEDYLNERAGDTRVAGSC